MQKRCFLSICMARNGNACAICRVVLACFRCACVCVSPLALVSTLVDLFRAYYPATARDIMR